MALVSEVSLIQSTAFVPFPDLANFILACETTVGYALGPHESYTPVTRENTYVLVPTKTTIQLPTPAMQETASETHLQKKPDLSTANELTSLRETFAQFLLTPLLWIYSATCSIASFSLKSAKYFTKSAGSVIQTAFWMAKSVLYWAARLIYVVPKYLIIVISTPFLKVLSLVYHLVCYFFSLAIVRLYLIPLSYITTLAAFVGSIVGLMAGVTIVAIQYIFPTKISAPASQVMVKEFTSKQKVERKQSAVKIPSLIIPRDPMKPERPKPVIYEPPKTILTPPLESTVSLTPEFLTPEDSPSSVGSFTSGKHGAFSSDYEEEPANVAPPSEELMDRLNGDEIHLPLYEDEDGYFNYVLSSVSPEPDYPMTMSAAGSTLNTAATSPVTAFPSPTEGRFKLNRSRGNTSPTNRTSDDESYFDKMCEVSEPLSPAHILKEEKGRTSLNKAPSGKQATREKAFSSRFEAIEEERDEP